MKKILITGAHSYIGVNFEEYAKTHYLNKFSIDTVNMEDESWKHKDFSVFDTIFHVAGIAHADIGKVDETSTNESLTFDESDKEAICNILRPIIKSLNSDDFYAAVCASLTQTKLLKTFSTLSEDTKTLTIRLTRNKFFNAELTEFISEHVVSLFKSSIDAEFLGKYELTADGGSVVITKVG